jgi:uncharacterized protein
VDLSSKLRAIVKSGPPKPARELTYEPDTGGYEATTDVSRLAEILGGRPVATAFGDCLAIDRRYDSDRWHGGVRIGDCELEGRDALDLLDPSLRLTLDGVMLAAEHPRTVFIDLETTGISGGAGIVAFVVGCAYFDMGALQVRQFLLTSYAAERALLAAVAEFFAGAELIVTYNGKTFDVPVMETRWTFHRMRMPLEGVPHFDMLHPARRLWKGRAGALDVDEGACRLTTLERALLDVTRVGDVDGFEIPGRFFHFLRTGDPRPLEPVLEHNRLDLVSLAAVTGRAARLARQGADVCRDCAEALALGRVYERAGSHDRAEACYRKAAQSGSSEIRIEALFRLGVRCRRERRFTEAATAWEEVLAMRAGVERDPVRLKPDATYERGRPQPDATYQRAAEALAIHHEHRARDYETARELALFALDEVEETGRRAEEIRYRLARLDRKLSRRDRAPRLW